MTLIEGMMASLVMLTGMIGVLQGLLTASQQNSMANRMTRSSAVARQAIMGMTAKGRDRLLTGLLSGTNCTTGNVTLEQLTDGLSTIGAPFTVCVADLDAYETALLPAVDRIVANYSAEDRRVFRRVVVMTVDPVNDPAFVNLSVVVSWNELGRRKFHRQQTGAYNAAANQMGIEL